MSSFDAWNQALGKPPERQINNRPASEFVDKRPRHLRHAESSETDRLNQSHWSRATGQTLNETLMSELPTIRARSRYEAINNPTLEGLIHQHTIAVVGENGPKIDLYADDEAADKWCLEAEDVWDEWSAKADAAGQQMLGSRLKQWNRLCWTDGEFLEQLIYDKKLRDNEIQLRLFDLEIERLQSPSNSLGDTAIIMGVKRSRERAPEAYWISDELASWRGKGQWVPADNIMHGFQKLEVGQARGLPWVQSGLPTAADIRDYDLSVLDAARQAAENATFAVAKNESLDFDPEDAPEFQTYRRRVINYVTPGWDVNHLNSNQPTATYKEHRQERQGDLGRPQGVPSMVTRLDARDHNYSSARFDYGMLFESAKHVRATIYNPKLLRLWGMVLTEATLAGIIRPAPTKFWMQFIWPALPQIDLEKDAKAERLLLGNGTLPFSDACAARGDRSSDIIRKRRRDKRQLQQADLPTVEESMSAVANVRTEPTLQPS